MKIEAPQASASTCSRPELEQLKREVSEMRLGQSQGRSKPHKPALLLAVLDLAEDGLLCENRILFNDALFDRFSRYFDAARDGNDWSQIAPPFFHLRAAPFWCHKVKAGREEAYAALKSSGGGFKRITDNIECAYLSGYAFRCVQDSQARQELRECIMALFPTQTANLLQSAGQAGPQKRGTVFHESLRLVRPVLKEVLRIAMESGDQRPNFDTFRDNSQVGTNYIKATRAYAFVTGLVDANEKPTAFGRHAYAHDTGFNRTETMWMLHYFLVAPHASAPQFWNDLAAKYFAVEAEFSRDAVRADIDRITRSLGVELADKSLNSTTNIFLSTYIEPDSLGGLGILKSVGPPKEGPYAVGEEFAPRSPGVVACALGDFWAAHFGGSKKVNLHDVTGATGLGPLLGLSPGEMQRALGELQARGLVALERATRPFQIARAWQDPASLWEQLYD